MANVNQNLLQVPEILRKQLSLAVRSIQWSYAIIWSISATQPGVLEWGEGYYNGDIKTRKTVQAVDINPDDLGLQRSDQLRELYESLSLGETIPQAKRPTAALSPEDLTDAEWYFLVCMSFKFNIGQGLPGRTLEKNQTVWLCNAHRADTKVFCRSLLAKSALMQTIVCFPHLGGVVEIGTTEVVPEDLNLIHHIRTSFLESPANVPDLICEVLNHASIPENDFDQLLDCNFDMCSPKDSSDDFADNLLIEESNFVEGLDGEISQLQSWPFMDDAISNCLNNSVNSSDCTSQSNHETFVPFTDGMKPTENNCVNETQECNQQKQKDDILYKSLLSNLLKNSHQLILGPYRNGNRESSFVGWKNGLNNVVQSTRTPQKLLKKVLFEVAKMHQNSQLESTKQNGKEDGPSKPAVDDVDRNHVLSERKRREKISERFTILGSLVPSGGKVDKVSILDHTIEHLRELERKVEELQSYKETTERESTTQTKPHDAIERTSDNYGPTRIIDSVKNSVLNKRKACDINNTGGENSKVRVRENIRVNITKKDVSIEMSCPWREGVLLDVMEEMSKLPLNSETVESSNTDGIFSMTIKAKCKGKGLKVASASVIKQAIQKVIQKS